MDTNYWDNFYKQNNDIFNQPSSFCKFIMDYFKKYKNLQILDAGCGNGRDSYYLSNKYKVVGMDTSLADIKDNDNCKFIKCDFCTYDKSNFNLIYSRFTFHSISNKDHTVFLKSITKSGTFLCIETRSDKSINSIRIFGDTHYRNFTNLTYLKNLLEKYKFEIKYIEENNNFAVYKKENPICIRVICKKI
jgi:tellurite methyltransferase